MQLTRRGFWRTLAGGVFAAFGVRQAKASEPKTASTPTWTQRLLIGEHLCFDNPNPKPSPLMHPPMMWECAWCGHRWPYAADNEIKQTPCCPEREKRTARNFL